MDWCGGVAMAKELPGVLGVCGWVGIQCDTVFALVVVSLVFNFSLGKRDMKISYKCIKIAILIIVILKCRLFLQFLISNAL